ncbi:hypothetical protein FB45DRAFT_717201, partial [Roridomyces roridus]
SFAAYSSPSLESRFSAEFFSNLTFADADALVCNRQLPQILPKGGIEKWLFAVDVPTSPAEIQLSAHEAVPGLEDLLPITQNMDEAYEQGARSLFVQLQGNLAQYHLSKVRLIINVNNHQYHLHSASILLQRVVSVPLLLPNLIKELQLSKISEPLAGFHVTQVPVYTLGCLLQERWASEDVLNARAELTYFRRAAEYPDTEPSFLFLPTS